MVLGFNEAFIPAILAGTKVHTIREGLRWQTGDIAHFCARTQQPDQYEFWKPRPLLAVQIIELTDSTLWVDGRQLAPAEALALANADGFATAAELLAFFANRPQPVRGQLLHWTALRY
ncbi:MAG: ASCH domain-containing protein [Janthinobacterium lividum]